MSFLPTILKFLQHHATIVFWAAIALLYVPQFLLSMPPESTIWKVGYAILILVCLAINEKEGVYNFLKKEITERLMRVLAQTTFSISLISCTLSILAHYTSFGWNAYDTGIFANNLAHLAQTGSYYSSFLEMPALGDHFSPNLFLLAPLFKIEVSALWLHFAKLLSFFSAALLLFRFGRLLEVPPIFNYATFILFIHHIFLLKALRFEFQPSALALPFIILAFQWAWQEKWGLLALNLVFLCGFKEHLPLIWVCVGFFLYFYCQKKQQGILIGILGIIMGGIIFGGIMPIFNEGKNFQESKLGIVDFWNLKIEFLLNTLVSVGFLPLFRPKTVLFFLPALAMTAISNYQNMTSLGFHYQDIGHTAMFVAILVCVKERAQFLHKFSIKNKDRAILLFLLILFAVHRVSPLIWVRSYLSMNDCTEVRQNIQQFTQKCLQSPEKYPLYVSARSSIYALGYLDLHDFTRFNPPNTPFWMVFPKDTLLLQDWERDTIKNYLHHIDTTKQSIKKLYINQKNEVQNVEILEITSFHSK
jgi:uncharacterized membrane protein